MKEEWKKYPEFPKYEVSDYGQVKNIETGNIIKLGTNPKGYIIAILWIDGKQVGRQVHRMVSMSFIDNIYSKPQVNHKDGNKTNNKLDNLEWVTRSENMRHAFDVLGYEVSNKIDIRLIDGDTIEVFNSIADAGRYIIENNKTTSKDYRIVQSRIWTVLDGRRKTAYGYKWEYV